MINWGGPTLASLSDSVNIVRHALGSDEHASRGEPGEPCVRAATAEISVAELVETVVRKLAGL